MTLVGWLRLSVFFMNPSLRGSEDVAVDVIRERIILYGLLAKKREEETRTMALIQAALASNGGDEEFRNASNAWDKHMGEVYPFMANMKTAKAEKVAKYLKEHWDDRPLVVRPIPKKRPSKSLSGVHFTGIGRGARNKPRGS